MKIVLDTNVLLAGVATHGLCEALVALALRDHTVFLSEFIILEFQEHYVDKFKATAEQSTAATKMLRMNCLIVEPIDVESDACDDPDDLPILGTAEAAGAEYLVTGDQGLLRIGNHKGIPILSPRQFYELIQKKN